MPRQCAEMACSTTIFFFLFYSLVLAIHYRVTLISPMKHSLIIHSGYSSTSFQMYRIINDRDRFRLPKLDIENSCRINQTLQSVDDLDEFHDKPWNTAKNYFEQVKDCVMRLVKSVVDQYPDFRGEQQIDVSFFGSTESRILKQTNSTRIRYLFEDINEILNRLKMELHNAFKINLSLNVNRVEILTKEKEALYKWLSLNFLYINSFKYKLTNMSKIDLSHTYSTIPKLSVRHSIGMFNIEPSYSSMVFELRENDKATSQTIRNFPSLVTEATMFEYDHQLIMSIEDCLGFEEFKKRMWYYLIYTNSNSDTIVNPCMPQGYNFSIYIDGFVNKNCLARNIKEKHKFKYDQYSLESKYDAQLCKIISKNIIIGSACSSTFKDCASQTEHSIPLPMDVIAISSYYPMTNFSGQDMNSHNFEGYVNYISKYCDDWTLDKSENKLHVELGQEDNCIKYNYLLTLLTNVYKINSEYYKRILFKNAVDFNKPDWTLGSILEKSDFSLRWNFSRLFLYFISVVLCTVVTNLVCFICVWLRALKSKIQSIGPDRHMNFELSEFMGAYRNPRFVRLLGSSF